MKTIVRRSPSIVTFVALLSLTAFSTAQRNHLQRFGDLLVVAPKRKTLAALALEELEGVDPSNLADFFRFSPWLPDELRQPLFRFVLSYLGTRGVSLSTPLFLTLDDSLALKDKATHKLQTALWHFDHNRKRSVRASVHVVLTISWGGYHFPLLWRLYLRAVTVRRLNKKRSATHKLRYYSKLELAQQMLEEVAVYLPSGPQVYVLLDSWYTSAKLLRWLRSRDWHVIAAVKSNRKLGHQQVRQWHHTLKGRRYERVRLRLANQRERTYCVRTLQGRLRGVHGDVRLVISQKRPGERSPRYFLCTDLTLKSQEILTYYPKRWRQEVDYWHVKLPLGLGDFRLHSYEAISKWYAVVYMVLIYLYWQSYERARPPGRAIALSEVIAQLRQEHQEAALRSACEEVAQGVPVEQVLDKYLGKAESPAA